MVRPGKKNSSDDCNCHYTGFHPRPKPAAKPAKNDEQLDPAASTSRKKQGQQKSKSKLGG